MVMTKSKAKKIVKALIEKYGKDFVLFKFYDEKKFKLEKLKRELNIKDANPCRVYEGYIRNTFTLEELDFLTDNEYTQLCDNITIESSSLKELGLQTIGCVVRQCESNMDYFKHLQTFPILHVDSYRELSDFKKAHEKEIKKYEEETRRVLNGLVDYFHI